MDARSLTNLDSADLAEYLWNRLRHESPLNPPLTSRFAAEAPAHFLLKVEVESDDLLFRSRLIRAVEDNIHRLASLPDDGDETADEQMAGLAFMVSEMKAANLVELLHAQTCSWSMSQPAPPLSFGQTHILRALAQLQEPGSLEQFWRDLWLRGPRNLRGLVYFGWVRSNAGEAYDHLGELADSGGDIDLPAAVWGLIGPGVSDIVNLAAAAGRCTPEQRNRIREALEAAGAGQDILRDYDLHSRVA